jgi:hypothetical protein
MSGAHNKSWSTAADLRAQVQRLWERGTLLASIVDDSPLFPLRLILKRPNSNDLSEQFESVRAWARELQHASKPVAGSGYRILLREARHRVLGTNSLPDEIWIVSVWRWPLATR